MYFDRARILVCAPSNAALDEMAARLMHGMLDKSGNVYSPMDGSIVRFGSYRAIHPIVQVISLDSLTQRLSGSGRPRAWADILDGASVVCATLSGCGSHTFDELEKMFDIVIIGESFITVPSLICSIRCEMDNLFLKKKLMYTADERVVHLEVLQIHLEGLVIVLDSLIVCNRRCLMT